MNQSQRFYRITVWYEFMAGIAKLYRPGKVKFTRALDKVLKVLTMFKDDPVYRQFQRFSHELKTCDRLVVLCTGIEALKNYANLSAVQKTRSYWIINQYLNNLHQVLLGNPDNRLAEYVKQYGEYRQAVK